MASVASRVPRSHLLLVGAITLAGLGVRIAFFGQSVFGDELSTLWLIDDRSLGDTLSLVRSDAEITPPLFFIFAWLSHQAFSDPEWIRLPSLIAGTATIPLIYLLGARTLGRTAGLAAAAIFAFSPFMVYYATDARAYALMLLLLTVSTLALLQALEDGRRRWWVIYALCSCAAMYSHYTVVFPLFAQAAWALWAHREAWRALLLANVGAALLFAPWLPGFIADNNSPTTDILSALSPFEFGSVRFALEVWTVGFPNVRLEAVPGWAGAGLLGAGLLLAAVAASARAAEALRRSGTGLRQALGNVSPNLVLVLALTLATPVGEAIFSAIGSNIFGARNLNASWPGLALAAGGLIAAAGPVLAVVSTTLVVAGLGVALGRALGPDPAHPNYSGVASYIEERADPGDVVVDAATFTPVPLTGLGAYLPESYPRVSPGLPRSDGPFLPFDPVTPPGRVLDRSFREAEGRRLFLVALLVREGEEAASTTEQLAGLVVERRTIAAQALRDRPPGFRIVERQRFDGIIPMAVFVLEDRGGAGPGA